ncbi:MAG: 15,16-dihydrobiliverdin:ferredoxin oxidoreductase [Cyanobacteria bacterium P01_G01_bin.54]
MYKIFQEYLEQVLFKEFNLVEQSIPEGLEHQISKRGRNPAKIESWHYACPEFRKVRYTYIDAGNSTQVFNGVIYPSFKYEMPVLGIDLLYFGKKKNLVVIDFQPLFRDEDYQSKYIEPMSALRYKYDDLAQDLGMRFYDANQYFSKNLLFARVDERSVEERVFPAFKDYVDLYLEVFEQVEAIESPEGIQRIVQAQKDYDQYSAERDPAHGLFSSYFGEEWANRFLYEFLFADATPVSVAH